MKECKRCKEFKEFYLFGLLKKTKDGLSYYCKKCECIRNKAYKEKNKESIKIKRNKYLEENKEYLLEKRRIRDRERYSKNKEFYKDRVKDYQSRNKEKMYKKRAEKIRKNPLLKLRHRITNLISINLKNKNVVKRSKTIEILGCDYVFFKEYISSQFKTGMNWDNIELDHIKPMHSAKTESEILELNHYTNFQPLSKKENREKSNKIISKQLKFL